MTAACPTCGTPRPAGTGSCTRCGGGSGSGWAAAGKWKRLFVASSLVVAIALTVAQLIWPRLDPEQAKARDAVRECRAKANDPIFDPEMRSLAEVPCDMMAEQYIARYGRKP